MNMHYAHSVRILWLQLMLSAAACSVEPPSGKFVCNSQAECPDGQRCDLVHHRCFDSMDWDGSGGAGTSANTQSPQSAVAGQNGGAGGYASDASVEQGGAGRAGAASMRPSAGGADVQGGATAAGRGAGGGSGNPAVAGDGSGTGGVPSTQPKAGGGGTTPPPKLQSPLKSSAWTTYQTAAPYCYSGNYAAVGTGTSSPEGFPMLYKQACLFEGASAVSPDRAGVQVVMLIQNKDEAKTYDVSVTSVKLTRCTGDCATQDTCSALEEQLIAGCATQTLAVENPKSTVPQPAENGRACVSGMYTKELPEDGRFEGLTFDVSYKVGSGGEVQHELIGAADMFRISRTCPTEPKVRSAGTDWTR